MNRLDRAIRLLKEQQRSLLSDKREIEKAMNRIDKALTVMGVQTLEDKKVRVRGPMRYDSNAIVLGAITTHVQKDGTFTRSEVVQWCTVERPDDPLRVGQVHGAIQKLVEKGIVSDDAPGRGVYRFTPKDAG